MGRIDLQHDGLTVEMARNPRAMPLLMWAGVILLSGFGTWALRPVLPWIMPVAAVVVLASLVAIARQLTRREHATMRCDGSRLTFDNGRTVSLLDIYSVGVSGPWLFFKTQAGPVPDFSIGPFLERTDKLEEVAEVLNLAVKQAEHRRGDAPDERYWQMKDVLKREEREG